MYPKKDNTLSLLGGAVLGAVAMFLLDPEAGERRRREVAGRAGDAASAAGDSLGPIWDRVSDTARNVGSGIAAGAGAVGQGIADKYADARDSHAARHVADHVSSLGDSLSDRLKQARKSAVSAAPSWLHREEPESHTGAIAAAGIGTLLAGAAAMYLLDPEKGRSRRANVVGEASRIVTRTGRTFRQVGNDLRNRATGYAHQARGWVETEDAVSAEQLLQRVRSEMGHVVSHAGAIQVMTDNHGRVTLHGKVLASEADKLLATVKGVGGVNELINLLSVKETEQQMQDANSVGSGSAATTQL